MTASEKKVQKCLSVVPVILLIARQNVPECLSAKSLVSVFPFYFDDNLIRELIETIFQRSQERASGARNASRGRPIHAESRAS